MSRKKYQPTNSELEILSVLWETGDSTAREVHNHLEQVKSTGYTTTLKIIQNMFDKGLLTRTAKGQTHLYSPLVKREDIQKNLLGGFVQKVFGGSSKNMILQALGNETPSKEELDEIRAMLDNLENKK